VRVALTFEIGDKVFCKVPSGPLKFNNMVGVIEDITQRWDEENDMSSTIFVVNVNGNLYNVARPQILAIATDDDHRHSYELRCSTCGHWTSNPND
jgi:hypothetical protein